MNLNGAGIVNYMYLVQGFGAHDATKNGNGLDISKYHRINIPHYQRPYRWGDKDNIKDLFDDYYDDMRNNSQQPSGYFLGATVAVENFNNDEAGVFEIIDGQQRLTTIYLMNFLLYFLQRRKVEHMIESYSYPANWSDEIDKLKGYYVERIGVTKKDVFDNLKSKIMEMINKTLDQTKTVNEVKKEALTLFREELGCVNEIFQSEKDLYDAIIKKSDEFFSDEELTLSYSREVYNDNLKEVLGALYLEIKDNPSSIELKFAEEVDDNSYKKTYYLAFEKIFACLYELEDKLGTVWDTLDKMIQKLEEIVKNLNVCIITTSKEEDANRLFEVLNDRAFEISDLELVKNHFLMVYCSKNKEIKAQIVDKNINKLDEIWSGSIFTSNETKKNRLIAYLATVYLTQDYKLDNKNEDKYKKALKESYTDQLTKYSFEDVQHDINVFLAMKKIVEVFGIKFQKAEKEAICVEADKDASIVLKTVLLLHALGRPAILAALTNVILGVYEYYNAKYEIDDFEKFLVEIKKKSSSIQGSETINKRAFELWKSNLLAESYNTPRERVARGYIENYGHKIKNIEYSAPDNEAQCKLIGEFDEWTENWKYGGKNLPVTILLLNLFQRNKKEDKLTALAYTYSLNAGKINLDHMEPRNIISSDRQSYFCSSDTDEMRRKSIVDSLGNMMILDQEPNIDKSNKPFLQGLSFYQGLYDKHWMLIEIDNMRNDQNGAYFINGVPQETFFEERKRNLRKYFKAILTSQIDDQEIKL